MTVPWGLLVAIEAPPDPPVIGPRAPSEDDAVGFGAARGECFGGPRITPRMTTKAAITAAAPATANVAVFEPPCQSRWLPAAEPLDFASAPLGAALFGPEPLAAVACPTEPAEDK